MNRPSTTSRANNLFSLRTARETVSRRGSATSAVAVRVWLFRTVRLGLGRYSELQGIQGMIVHNECLSTCPINARRSRMLHGILHCPIPQPAATTSEPKRTPHRTAPTSASLRHPQILVLRVSSPPPHSHCYPHSLFPISFRHFLNVHSRWLARRDRSLLYSLPS